MKKLNAYKEQNNNSFLLDKLKEARKERDDLKNRFVVADMYRGLWKITTLVLAAFILGRLLGGAL
jgi:hypothetical protein